VPTEGDRDDAVSGIKQGRGGKRNPVGGGKGRGSPGRGGSVFTGGTAPISCWDREGMGGKAVYAARKKGGRVKRVKGSGPEAGREKEKFSPAAAGKKR